MASGKDELGSYLEELSDEGVNQAEGRITLNPKAAIKKLAQNRLPDASSWVLKIVQAAVASSAQEVRFQFDRRSLVVSIDKPRGWSLTELERAIFSPQESSVPGLSELGISLGYLLSQTHWQLSIVPAYEETSLQFDSERQYSKGNCKRSETLFLRLKPATNDRSLMPFRSVYPALTITLTRRAYVCPIRLFVDGRRIDNLAQVGVARRPKAAPAILGAVLSQGQGLKVPEPVRKGEAMPFLVLDLARKDRLDYYYFLCATWKPKQESKEFKLELEAAPSNIHWVQMGVIIGSEPLNCEKSLCSLEVYANANDLETDLSTLSLRLGAQKDKVFDMVLPKLLPEIAKLQNSEFEQLFEVLLSDAKKNNWKMSVVTVAISLFIPPSAPFLMWFHFKNMLGTESRIRELVRDFRIGFEKSQNTLRG